MRVIPVIDLKGGLAVHAAGGDRGHYAPVRSALHHGADPLGLATAYRSILGLAEVYVADLDAIDRPERGPALDLYRRLARSGLSPWVDAGLRDATAVPGLLAAGVTTLIAGTETVRGPSALAEILSAAGDRTCFGLDLRAGRPILAADWGTTSPEGVIEVAVGLGARRILLLDLARVGRGGGTGAAALVGRVVAGWPGVEVAAGGGIGGIAEVIALREAGAAAVLIGSALHDGRIGRGEVARI